MHPLNVCLSRRSRFNNSNFQAPVGHRVVKRGQGVSSQLGGVYRWRRSAGTSPLLQSTYHGCTHITESGFLAATENLVNVLNLASSFYGYKPLGCGAAAHEWICVAGTRRKECLIITLSAAVGSSICTELFALIAPFFLSLHTYLYFIFTQLKCYFFRSLANVRAPSVECGRKAEGRLWKRWSERACVCVRGLKYAP